MKKLLTFCLLLLITGSLSAQDSSAHYSLKQALDFAFQNQGDLKNAILEQEIAHQKVHEIEGLGTPQINGNAEINNFLELPTTFVPGEFFGGEPGSFAPVKFSQKYSASVGVSASQLIFDGSYLIGLKATKAYQDLSRKQMHQTKTDLAVKVTKAYYAVLVMDARMEIIDANIQRLEKLMNDTKAMYQNGFAEKIDADRIQLSYNNLLVEKEKITRFKDFSAALLKFQMGLKPNAPITLTDKLADFPWQDKAMLADSVDVSKRPEFSLMQSQQRLQELDLQRYKSTYYPSLVGIASLSENASRNEFNIFNTAYRWYPTALVGLKLTVPIWDGLQKSARVNQSKLLLKKVNNSMEMLKDGLQLDYINARSNYQNNLSSLETMKNSRDLSTEIVRVSKVKYDNGVGSSLELIQAETSKREADANYFNTLYDTIIAKIDLDKSTGAINY
jgi:outer membrane protein TolC